MTRPVAPHPMEAFQARQAPITPDTLEVKPGRPHPQERGIVYRGPWETAFSGVPIAVRRHARALALTGPVFLESSSHTVVTRDGIAAFADPSLLEPEVLIEVGDLIEPSFDQPSLKIRHTTLERSNLAAIVSPPRIIKHFPDMLDQARKTTVLNTVFERATADSELRDVAPMLSVLADVWVPCSHNKRLLVECGVPEKKVCVVPHPLPDEDPLWRHERSRLDWRTGDRHEFRFLNVGKWEPRKGQHDMIGGFLEAFSPDDEAPRLVIKTSTFGRWKDYPEGPAASVRKWLEDPRLAARWPIDQVRRHIVLLTRHMTREDLVRLYLECDCYVSAGRAEGFDLPAFDAKFLGMRFIHAMSGGPEDFAHDLDVTINPCELVPVHKQYRWGDDAMWAGHDAQAVGQAMRRMWDRRKTESLEHGWVLDRSLYTMERVGRLMRDRCDMVIGRLTGGGG